MNCTIRISLQHGQIMFVLEITTFLITVGKCKCLQQYIPEHKTGWLTKANQVMNR